MYMVCRNSCYFYFSDEKLAHRLNKLPKVTQVTSSIFIFNSEHLYPKAYFNDYLLALIKTINLHFCLKEFIKKDEPKPLNIVGMQGEKDNWILITETSIYGL